MKRLIIAFVVLMQSLSFAQSFKLSADTVVDSGAWNFPRGNWGTTMNGQTFQQEGVITHKGYQYASYFADGGVLAVARRQLPDGQWETIHFPDYKAGDRQDSHNVAAIGIAEGDGTIHLAFDHHNDPLHYRRSVQGLASDPGKFQWKAEHFGPVTNSLEGIGPVKEVTYPHMVSAPGGKLQMLFRIGSSGNGDWHLFEYDPAGAGKWTNVGLMLSRAGAYQISPSRCAYPNPIRYDAKGVLHVTWCWREQPKGKPFDLRTNHDILYAYSEDQGRTWKNNGGNVIADLTGNNPDQPKSIGIDTMGIVVVPTKWLWGQMNTNTQTIDAQGRVHIISWQLPNDAKEGTKDLNQWRYHHYWRDGEGTWHENKLPFHGRKPQLVFDPAGNAVIVYCATDNANYHGVDPGGKLTIMTARQSSKWTDWTKVAEVDRISVGEPLLDHPRWTAEGILSVYLQDKPAEPGQPSALRVIDFRIESPAQP
jgi:hypothetical protein